MRSFIALLLTLTVSISAFGQSQSELRQLRKQWEKDQKAKIRNSGYDQNKSGRLSATERKKLQDDWKKQIREEQKKRGKK